MGYIYKITNTINNKIYIGQTVQSLNMRWNKHTYDAKVNCDNLHRPLYNAFRKYGMDNFKIELIEEVPNEKLNEREKHWINYYDSYNNGYNATLGGDTTILYNYNEIAELYQKYQNASEVARQIGCQCTTVLRALKSLNIEVIKEPLIRSNSYKVNMFDLQNNYIKTFSRITDAAQYLIDHNYTTNLNLSSIVGKIKLVCDKKRKTAYKFIWSYAD